MVEGRMHYEAKRLRSVPSAVRRRIWDSPCAVCGREGKSHVDHIIPRSQGGAHEEANLQPLCPRCNNTKGGRLMTNEEIRAVWRRTPQDWAAIKKARREAKKHGKKND